MKFCKLALRRLFIFIVSCTFVCYPGFFTGGAFASVPLTCETKDLVRESLKKLQFKHKETDYVFYADCNDLIKVSPPRLFQDICIADYYRLQFTSQDNGFLYDGSLIANGDCNFERSFFVSNTEHLTSEDDYALLWAFLSGLTTDFKGHISERMELKYKLSNLDYFYFLFNEDSMSCFDNSLQEFSVYETSGFFTLHVAGSYASWYLRVKIEDGELFVVGLTKGEVYDDNVKSGKFISERCNGHNIRTKPIVTLSRPSVRQDD
jgi:hypothetical protein